MLGKFALLTRDPKAIIQALVFLLAKTLGLLLEETFSVDMVGLAENPAHFSDSLNQAL